MRLYLARTSTGKEVTLKLVIRLYGVMGMEPVPVPAGVVIEVRGEAADVIAGDGGAKY